MLVIEDFFQFLGDEPDEPGCIISIGTCHFLKLHDYLSIASDHHRHATRQAVFIPEEDATPIPTHGLLKGPSRLELRANFFSQRVVNTWNALPLHIKNSLSVNSFKNNYDKLHFN